MIEGAARRYPAQPMARRTGRPGDSSSVAEVDELQIEPEIVGGAQEANRRLQVVAVLAGDAHLLVLNLRLHLELRVFDQLDDLFALLASRCPA